MQILQTEVTDPTVHQAEAQKIVLNNKNQIWPKRPTNKHPAPAVPGCPKLPPGNPRLLVDVHKEPTFEVGEVLL